MSGDRKTIMTLDYVESVRKYVATAFMPSGERRVEVTGNDRDATVLRMLEVLEEMDKARDWQDEVGVFGRSRDE